jgi:hypothetical protein
LMRQSGALPRSMLPWRLAGQVFVSFLGWNGDREGNEIEAT